MNIIDRVMKILYMDEYEFAYYLSYQEGCRRENKLILATLILISVLLSCILIGHTIDSFQHTSAPFLLVSLIYFGWCMEIQDKVIITEGFK